MAPFRSVKTHRVSEDIVKQIQEAIFRGEWRPGEKLPPERELVRQFEASRASVREAIRILEMSGMLVVRQGAGGGTIVAEPTFQMVSNTLLTMLRMNKITIAELYRARLILEPAVAEMAALHVDDQDIADLEGIVASIRRLASEGKPTSAESYRFHFSIAQASKSSLLAMLVSSLLDLVRLSDIADAHETVDSPIVVDEHQALVEALRERDPDKARRLAHEHLSHLFEYVSNRREIGTGDNQHT